MGNSNHVSELRAPAAARPRQQIFLNHDRRDPGSRIEGLTRHYGVDLLVGEDTRSAVGELTAAGAGEMGRRVGVDRVRVKGKRRPVTLFTPVVAAAERTLPFDEKVRL